MVRGDVPAGRAGGTGIVVTSGDQLPAAATNSAGTMTTWPASLWWWHINEPIRPVSLLAWRSREPTRPVGPLIWFAKYPACHREERSDVAISLNWMTIPPATRLPRCAGNDFAQTLGSVVGIHEPTVGCVGNAAQSFFVSIDTEGYGIHRDIRRYQQVDDCCFKFCLCFL